MLASVAQVKLIQEPRKCRGLVREFKVSYGHQLQSFHLFLESFSTFFHDDSAFFFLSLRGVFGLRLTVSVGLSRTGIF